mmetsp:Transcript_38777/g.116068  ORF Transcript_38777/g.116068 Transcript_38777/m.116068 type:complete len:285 (+) Transcript_38777:251-1105(+)
MRSGTRSRCSSSCTRRRAGSQAGRQPAAPTRLGSRRASTPTGLSRRCGSWLRGTIRRAPSSPSRRSTIPSCQTRYYCPTTKRAYETVRGSGMRAGQVAFVLQLYGLGAIFSLGWAALDSPEGLPAARYPNIIFDLHLYYGVLVPPFPALFDRLASPHFVAGPLVHLESMLLDVGSRPALTGEWSLRTPYATDDQSALPRRFDAQSDGEHNATMRALGRAQLGAHNGASSIFARLLGGRTRRAGAFFWTWGGAPHGEEEFWSFEAAIERGWLPPVRMWGSPLSSR